MQQAQLVGQWDTRLQQNSEQIISLHEDVEKLKEEQNKWKNTQNTPNTDTLYTHYTHHTHTLYTLLRYIQNPCAVGIQFNTCNVIISKCYY